MIFISHNYNDKPIVEPIAIRLAQIYGQDQVFMTLGQFNLERASSTEWRKDCRNVSSSFSLFLRIALPVKW